MARVCSSSRLPPARSVGGQAGIHVEHAGGLLVGGEHAGRIAAHLADAHQRHGYDAAQLQIDHAALRLELAGALRIEIHGEQIAPLLQGALDDAAGNAQVAGRERGALAIARHARLQVAVLAQQQEAALGAGDGQGRVHHGIEHILQR